MAFGSAIKKLREDAGISVDKLTALIGVKAARWRKWEEKDFDPRDADQAAIESFFSLSLREIGELHSIKEFLKVPKTLPTGVTSEVLSTAQILTILTKAIDKQADAHKEQASALRLQAEFLKSIENKMAQESTQAKIKDAIGRIEASLPDLFDRQEGGFAIVIELLKRDALREAGGNQEKFLEILDGIVRRIGPALSPRMKENIGADGRN